MKIEKSRVKKILVIKLRGIGDVILSTIVFDPIKREFPNAKIDFLVDAPGSFGLKHLPILNDVIIFKKGNLLNRIKQFLAIRKNKYDLIIDLYSNPASAQVTKISGARYRVGFPYRGRKYAYNIYGPNEERAVLHEADLHLELLKSLNVKVDNSKLYYGLDNISNLFAEKYISDNFLSNSFVLGVLPSGSWQSKKCPPEKFAILADRIVDEIGVKILVIWGPDDKIEAESIVKYMKNDTLLAPHTSILEMGALINNCTAIIANDSGPMHIAAALGIPTLSIHGPTNPKLQGAYGDKHEFINLDSLDCIICNLLVCPKKQECFYDLSDDLIFEKFKTLLSKNGIGFTN